MNFKFEASLPCGSRFAIEAKVLDYVNFGPKSSSIKAIRAHIDVPNGKEGEVLELFKNLRYPPKEHKKLTAAERKILPNIIIQYERNPYPNLENEALVGQSTKITERFLGPRSRINLGTTIPTQSKKTDDHHEDPAVQKYLALLHELGEQLMHPGSVQILSS